MYFLGHNYLNADVAKLVSHLTFNQECLAHRRFESSHPHHLILTGERNES